eukprot:CAMPEP_0184344980 /NCGR_PEP_ID=MMETSP1089-20130417/13442_1 /TAXON_ID=38269 ORGANISM="Gloeochaete wittrockiana, Strain SAG46.84" /NCGR_SAMPLE_ID=MMETSP1089 /ASSEMBLY_ACC=CAM_ASM_000445 /LENGTH=99 /DNA_ID=CAMNT_0026675103 /DNA_START=52 /DNA_END=351 /DNA_ORIENTATION=+
MSFLARAASSLVRNASRRAYGTAAPVESSGSKFQYNPDDNIKYFSYAGMVLCAALTLDNFVIHGEHDHASETVLPYHANEIKPFPWGKTPLFVSAPEEH